MFLDTLIDHQLYFKATLISCLQEARVKFKKENPQIKKEIPISYKMILERERKRVPVYLEAHRDPANGWRMYSGKQIRKIVEYEIDRTKK